MLIMVTPPDEPASLQPQAPPPPILPKPGVDNLRLQKLLKKTAKKKSTISAQQATSFRSNLSPVSEVSPDLEHNARSSPLKPAGTVTRLTINLPPRFSIRPLIHHVPSPVPKGKPFTFTITEQRSLSEHLRLTVSPTLPHHKLNTPEPFKKSPEIPSDPPTHLATATNTAFPVQPISPTPCAETPVTVIHVAETHSSFHSVQIPRARSPLIGHPEEYLNSEGKLSSVHLQTNHSATLPRQTPDTPFIPKLDVTATTEPPARKVTTKILHVPRQYPIITSPTRPWDRPVSPGRSRSPDPYSVVQRQSCPSPSHHIGRETHIPAPSIISTPGPLPDRTPPPEATAAASQSYANSSPSPKPVLPLKNKNSAWSRLKKHLIVESEVPQFPVSDPEPTTSEQVSKKTTTETSEDGLSQDQKAPKSKAIKMWDAILYQMTVSKERKQQAEEKEMRRGGMSSFRRCLPLLLHRPRFDARKLKELASKPMSKITTLFEVRHIQPQPAEGAGLHFNRTASGWQEKGREE